MFKAIFSFYFDKLTDPLGLPLDALLEYIIIAIIGELAFQGAFSLIGALYEDGWISGRGIGSLLHWICRFIIYLIVWAITYFLIVAYEWIKSNLIMSIFILVGIVILTVGGYYIIKKIFSLNT